MNVTIPAQARVLILAGTILCALAVACSPSSHNTTQHTNNDIPTLEVPAAEVDYPDYLTYVWPLPETRLESIEYHRTINSTIEGGVGARLLADRIYPYYSGEKFGQQEYSIDRPFILHEHAELMVDGEIIPRERMDVYDLLDLITIRSDSGKLLYQGSSQIDLMWRVPLSVGKHTVSLRIYNSSKNIILEYTWQFSIVD